MKPWKKILLLALTVLPLTLAGAACGDDDDGGTGGNGGGANAGGEARKVTVMLDWTPNTNHAGLFLAKEHGFFADEGLDVDIVEATSGGVAQVLAAGRADFGISVQEAVIPARAEGIPIVSIAAIIQHNTSSLISLANDNITRPRDLEGKTYGGFGGALETALIERLVQCDGGDPSNVRFVDVGNVDYLVGMEQNQFDFAWIFDAWDGIRYSEIEGRDVNTLPFIDYTECIPDWYTPLLATSESMIADNPDVVRRFLAAASKGYELAMDDPAASAEAIAKNAPEADRELLDASAEYLATRYVDEGRQWGLQDEEIWTQFESFLREAGLTDDELDVTKAFTNDFLPAP